jgi:hypothetical protein
MMLAHVFGCKVSDGLPAIVTSPGRSGCRYWRWLPRVRDSSQPATSICLIASRTLTGIVEPYDHRGHVRWGIHAAAGRRPRRLVLAREGRTTPVTAVRDRPQRHADDALSRTVRRRDPASLTGHGVRLVLLSAPRSELRLGCCAAGRWG